MALPFQVPRRMDMPLLLAAVALGVIGLFPLYSLAEHGTVSSVVFWKQAVYILIGTLLALGIARIDLRVLRRRGEPVLALWGTSVISLLGLFALGRVIRGNQAWYRIGAFSVAPVEFAKVALILLLAKFFSDRHRDLYTVRHLAVAAVYLGGLALPVLAQPDLGSALVLIALWGGMVLFTGIRARWVIALVLGAAVALGIGWHWGLKPYQKDRIMVFLDPAREPKGYGYNVIQSRVAIGSGGFWGKGFGEGSQGAGRFLPESSTDFIFAVIAEEQGLLGVAALFTFFGMLWWRLIRGGRRAGHNFARIVLFGAAWLLVLHFAINVGMNLGLLPVIGLPLPFVSYGGSHVLAEFILIGICLALLAERSSTGPSPDVSAGGTPFPLSVDSRKNDAS